METWLVLLIVFVFIILVIGSLVLFLYFNTWKIHVSVDLSNLFENVDLSQLGDDVKQLIIDIVTKLRATIGDAVAQKDLVKRLKSVLIKHRVQLQGLNVQ